ncbi:MAG: ATP synthase F1 subunit delta [Bdellovibrionaceae bacterium]|nr:ATP synthase F1 subunit delta [Pseudobdellovibrionaceae bacterium]
MSSQVVQSYASAFCEMAQEQGKVNRFIEEVQGIIPVFKEKDVMSFFKSPLFSSSEKEDVVTKALGSTAMDPVMADFIKLLAKNGRLHLFAQIIEEFQGSCAGQRGARGEISISQEMPAAEKEQIQKAIEKKLSMPIQAEFKVDKNLHGGVEAKVGSYIIEDSLRSNLQKMGETLKRSSN